MDFPLAASIPARESGHSDAHVDVRVPIVVLARRRRRLQLLATAALGIARRSIALARDPLERIDRQPRRRHDPVRPRCDRLYRVHRRTRS
jgi:hypothetical protein